METEIDDTIKINRRVEHISITFSNTKINDLLLAEISMRKTPIAASDSRQQKEDILKQQFITMAAIIIRLEILHTGPPTRIVPQIY